MMYVPTWTPILFHIFLGGHHRRIIPYDINGPFKQAMMSLFRLAWSSKVQLPLLITVCFMAFDIRLQIEINIFWDQANHRRRDEDAEDAEDEGRVRPLAIAPLALAEQALLGTDTSDEDEDDDDDDDEDDDDDSDTDTEDEEDKDKKKKKKKDGDDDKTGQGPVDESSHPSSSSGPADRGGGPGPRDRDRDDNDEGRDVSLVLQVELHHGRGGLHDSDSDNMNELRSPIREHFDNRYFLPKTSMTSAKIQKPSVPLNILQKYLEKKTLVSTVADKWKLTSYAVGRGGRRDLFV